MGDILKKAAIDISTAFDANKAKSDTKRLETTVKRSAEDVKNARLKELELLFKEGKINAEQLAALKKRLDASTFNDELNREKRLHALKLKHANERGRIAKTFDAAGAFVKNPTGTIGAATSSIPGGVAVAAGFAALGATVGVLNKKIVDVAAGYEKQLNIIQTGVGLAHRALLTHIRQTMNS